MVVTLILFRPVFEKFLKSFQTCVLSMIWPSQLIRSAVILFHSPRQSASQEEGYDKVNWTSDVETHPPWLRFHLGITRWELYDRKDPNLAKLTHYLATQRILCAGRPERREGAGLRGEKSGQIQKRYWMKDYKILEINAEVLRQN